MSDIKEDRRPGPRPGDYNKELSRMAGRNRQPDPPADRHAKSLVTPNGRDVGSWDAYRNWLTKVQAPEQRRSLPDPALFSWKGYRSWAEKVRRDWDSED